MSAQLERPRGALIAAERLRTLSRLALAAIERDDLATLAACAAESDALVRALTRSAGLDEETLGLLSDVRAMNARISARLIEERDRIAEELVRVGACRARLREAALAEELEPSGVDVEG